MSEHLYFKGRTRLTFATLSGDADGVRRLLESGADPNRPNDRGDYALILATTNNNPDVVQTLLRAGAFAFRHRRNRKREFRRLWIQRINAAARVNGITYSKLVYGMKTAGIDIDRRALSELAFLDPSAFTAVVDSAKEALAA